MHSTREVTIRSDDKVWFDSDLRRESRKRDRLRQIFFRTKTETAEKKFKTQRNKFNNLKKQAKQRFTIILTNILMISKQ
jgi:hypothetical protein